MHMNNEKHYQVNCARTLSYNLVAIMKAATALIAVSSPSIITP